MSEKEKLIASQDQTKGYPENTYTTPPPVYDEGSQKVVYNQPSANTELMSCPPPDYLYLSLFSIILCCWPIGLVALVKSIDTRNHIQAGRSSLAYTTSREARMYNKAAIIVGLIMHIIAWILIAGSTVARITLEAHYDN